MTFKNRQQHIFLKCVTLLAAAAACLTTHAQSSKLAQGNWVKVKVTQSGMCQITAQQARQWGLSDDLSRITVHGAGGAMMPETIGPDLYDDLPQQPTVLSADGSKLLFYAQGPTTWQRGSRNFIVPQPNPYAQAGYYFVTDDNRFTQAPPQESPLAAAPAGEVSTMATAMAWHEQELVNPGQTGRVFLGEDFTGKAAQTFGLDLPGLVSGSTVHVRTVFASKVVGNGLVSRIECSYNGTPLASDSEGAPGVSGDAVSHTHFTAFTSDKQFELTGTEHLDYGITFKPGTGTLSLARLDYIAVNYQRTLNPGGGSMIFYARNDDDVQYVMSNAGAGIHVWDISLTHAPREVPLVDGAFSLNTGKTVPLVAFDTNGSFFSPELEGKVDNQDIHGEPTPDMIILAPSEFLTQAQRLADAHTLHDDMRVLVLDHKKVFNEFSSGAPDATAYRLLNRHFWLRGADEEGHQLRYMLLLGNGSYDNRCITAEVRAMGYPMLLTWQSPESDTEEDSFTSDDYFAVAGDDATGTFYRHPMSVAIGRLPAQSVAEATTLVNKAIKYITVPDYGMWKNMIVDVADDEDNAAHMQQAENVIAAATASGGESYMHQRVYLDAFAQASNGSTRKYPDANKRLFAQLKDGAVWWNYAGHASPSTWSADGLLTSTDVDVNLFYHHLPVLMAATCEYARFDQRERSGAEKMMLNASGGAIGVICPARLVFMDRNSEFQQEVARQQFQRDDNGKTLALGEIVRRAKNNKVSQSSVAENNAHYIVLGDPALRPAFPTHKVVVDAINGKAVDPDDMPVFQARQTITFTGHIENAEGERDNGFYGNITSTLYDCEQSVTTHGYGRGREFTYEERANKLAINSTVVDKGEFTIKVVIPSEVTVSYDNYRPSLINLYACDESSAIEANGSNDSFYIYGYDETVTADVDPPVIHSMYLNNEDFKSGDNVNESPLLCARVSDESGINFSSAGIGHSITLTLDEKTIYSDVTSHYTPYETDNGGTDGIIRYPLSDLSDGYHTLKLKVWDVFSNSAEHAIDFNVARGLKPDVTNVYCDANPASSSTNFYVVHNRPNATVTVTVSVYNLLGRQVWTTTQTGQSDMFHSFPINWDLNYQGGGRVPRGIYVYRASISTDGQQFTSKSKKLAVTD